MDAIAGWIAEVLAQPGKTETEQRVRKQVAELAVKFPIYESRVQGHAPAEHARLH
jgi:glycine/serine hydroxymethyltransferase